MPTNQPEFVIRLLGANIFIPDLPQPMTGILLDVRIRNVGGMPSIATDWALRVIAGDCTVLGQWAQPDGDLRLTGQPSVVIPLSDIQLEAHTSRAPLKRGEAFIHSKILFYVPLDKGAVLHKNTVLSLEVSDADGRVTSTTQRVGDWIA